jgi:nucleotide-binding universal stress UspA family protein
VIPTAERRPARHRETRGGPASRPIVVCVAGASTDRAVSAIAGALARPLDAPLLLATVQQPSPGTASDDDVTALLASVARELERPAELRVAMGEPAERLLALAEREAAELVVVAASRRPPAEALRLGNVHLALAGAAPCPVVVVPTGVTALREDGPIVCGVDGSASSLAAAQVGADLAGRLGTRLLLVYVARGLRAADAPGRILHHTA